MVKASYRHERGEKWERKAIRRLLNILNISTFPCSFSSLIHRQRKRYRIENFGLLPTTPVLRLKETFHECNACESEGSEIKNDKVLCVRKNFHRKILIVITRKSPRRVWIDLYGGWSWARKALKRKYTHTHVDWRRAKKNRRINSIFWWIIPFLMCWMGNFFLTPATSDIAFGIDWKSWLGGNFSWMRKFSAASDDTWKLLKFSNI